MAKRVEQRPGIGVDASGGQVIDPTKNVEDLARGIETRAAELRVADQRYLDAQFSALEKSQNFAREANYKLNNFAREAGEKLEAALRNAETARVNELAATRKEYEDTIRDMLSQSTETNSKLVASQLVQIQNVFDTRVSKLEAYQFTQAGRSSVSDPALSVALAEMATSIQALTRSSTKTDTRREGMANLGSIIIGAAIVVSSLMALATFIVARTH
jgi:DNA repair exonuclease SbcCD ATPase subunit